MIRKLAFMFGAAVLSVVSYAPQASAQAAPGGKQILIVCGDENGQVEICTSIDDVALKNRLEFNLGHRVTMIPHNAEAAQLRAAADTADLVIIVESVNSGSVGTDLVATTTPILISESFLQDEFGLVIPPFVPVDPGYPGGITTAQLAAASTLLSGVGLRLNIEVPPPAPRADGAPPLTPQQVTQASNQAYNSARDRAIAAAVAGAAKPSHGVTINQLHVIITNPAHPLAAGLAGRVQVYRVMREMNWGAHLAPGAQVVATLAPPLEAAADDTGTIASNYSAAAVVYFVPRGGQLANGATAAGLRIQYFVENENGPGTYNLMTEDGFRLFDAAIDFALTTGSGM